LRYFIELSYNGQKYHGWQKQPNAVSIQETIEKALTLLLGVEILVVGCGRTDTGVHASQFFLHFDADKKIDNKELLFKLNAFLPNDIAIDKILLVSNDSHARFSAMYRSYEYRIHLGKNPFLFDTTWQLQNKIIDIVKMNIAAKVLYDYENFKCFSRSKTDVKTYNCTITEAKWEKDGNLLIFYITANRFLRNMVRAIVGTLLEVGQGKMSIEDFRNIIESKDRKRAGVSVKAKGLFLTKVGYPKNIVKE